MILAVTDDSIQEVSGLFNNFKGLCVHLSGSKSIDLIKQKNKAVMWPIVSMTGQKLSFRDVPFCVETQKENEHMLLGLIGILQGQPVICDYQKRERLHLAAVICNNFTNFLFTKAEKMLGNHDELKLMLPMMAQTIENWEKISPEKTQTGPAKRRDHSTINQHMDILDKYPDIKEIYQFLSKQIEINYA